MDHAVGLLSSWRLREYPRSCGTERVNRAVFLKAHGTGDAPMADGWLAAGSWLIDPGRTAFPRRPRMSSGDRLVLYASVWQRVFGVAEVISEPTIADPMAARWPWSVQVELLLVVPVLSNAPPVEAIGVAARSMSQQSHIRLRPEHWARAVEALAGVAL
jgi:hypothetical protein